MKKLFLLSALVVFAGGMLSAQNYMVVNTEEIFKSMPAYNAAVAELDTAAKTYQKTIDDSFAELEGMYEKYMSRKATLSASVQQQQEEVIVGNEKKILEYQESIFGTEGTLAKEQTAKLEPYQKKVMEAIGKYASDHGFALVLDVSTNPMVIYYDPAVDKTEQIKIMVK